MLFLGLCFYSIPQPQESLDGGEAVTKTVQKVFQVIHKNAGRRRIRTIPTIKSLSDKSETAKLALFVQPLSVWSAESEENGPLHVLADCDPYWVVPDDLAPFGVLQSRLLAWGGVQPSSTAGCQALADCTRAIPLMPLTDKDCPTVLVLRALKHAGWRQNPRGRVLHNAENSMLQICDARGGVKQKRGETKGTGPAFSFRFNLCHPQLCLPEVLPVSFKW